MAKQKAKVKNCQLIVKVTLSHREKINSRQLDFFSSKNIRGLLKISNSKKGYIEYTGPVGISLADRLKKPISKFDFLFVMEQIVDVVQKLNANSLVVNNVLFDVQSVYINETTRELQFVYLPLEVRQVNPEIIGFMEQIIYSAIPMLNEDTEYISRFVYYIKSLKAFDPEIIEKFIYNEDKNIVNTIKSHNVGLSGFMTDKPADYYAHYDKKDNDEEEQTTRLLFPDDDDEATGLLTQDDEEATGLLIEPQVYYPNLYRQLTNEMISVNKPVFRIGKERSYSDYFVGNNDKVSRSHADIITRGNHYYIKDLNSKNRTFINGAPIMPQQETEIQDGDRIRLANEEFEFRV